MTAYDFIFSNKLKPKLARHTTFWVIFSLQTVLLYSGISTPSDFFYYQVYKSGLYFLCCILPVCGFPVYISIYLLLPFIHKKKYVFFITSFIILIVFNCITSILFYVFMRPFLCPDCDKIDLREKINMMGNNGINIASFMALVALGIKFTKNWYQQQIKNRLLARQKIANELKLIKSRIQPDFLFDSLHSLYNEIATNKNQAAKMLLQFSEILSYMLYECNEDFVLAEKEIIIIKEFLALEKILLKKELSFSDNTGNSINNKYIPSFTLLSLIQSCIIALHNIKTDKVNIIELEIYEKEKFLYSKLSGYSIENKQNLGSILKVFLTRLETFYKNQYFLRFAEQDEDRFIIEMSFALTDYDSLIKTFNTKEKNYAYADI